GVPLVDRGHRSVRLRAAAIVLEQQILRHLGLLVSWATPVVALRLVSGAGQRFSTWKHHHRWQEKLRTGGQQSLPANLGHTAGMKSCGPGGSNPCQPTSARPLVGSCGPAGRPRPDRWQETPQRGPDQPGQPDWTWNVRDTGALTLP